MTKGGVLQMVDLSAYRRDLKKMQLGAGEAVEIRIMRVDEAKRLAQLRLWFALVREMSEYTGYDVREMHELAKVAVREPDWPDSLSVFTKDQMSAAITNVLRWSAETLGLALEAA
ncbi:MAG TPA: hypothetical protein VMS40_18520 [Vicinamibacterales bacterium]|nr:hypothetical protein [Vicinamibacterales bacterium]